MSRYKAYPEYRESKVKWLGKIPEHWQIKDLKYIANIYPSNVDKKSVIDQEKVMLCNYTDVYYNDVITNEIEFMVATATGDQKEKFTLKAGDTLITKDSESPEDIAISAYVKNDLPNVLCGYHLALVRPFLHTSGAFIKRLFDSNYIKSVVATRANGLTRYGLSQYAIDNLIIATPCKIEQQKIADFLDYETSKIDQLINKQKALIELLKEKRQALISQAVTKGLNPHVKMKDSGIEWLGKVPEHWKLIKLSYVLKLQSGNTITSDSIEFEGEYPVYGGNGLRGYTETYNCEGIYILIGRQGALCGNINIAKGKFFASEHALVVYPLQKIDTDYISNLLGFMNLGQYSVSAAQPGISVERINLLPLLLPPLAEQIEIADYVNKEILKIKKLIEKATKAVNLLQERRTALISAAVTGKIDVRDWQSPNAIDTMTNITPN